MPVDADDCLSKHLAEFVNRNSHCNGWFINKGYEYQEGSRLIYLRQEDMFDVEPAISSNTTCSIYLKISTTTNRVSTIQNMGGSENLWKSREPY